MAQLTLKKDWKSAVIEGVANGLTVKDAAARAGISRTNVYIASDKDDEFAAAMRRAHDEGADQLEAEARRRAVEGVTRKKFDKGVPIIDPQTGEQYIEREYSDTLLIFLLKGRRPDIFGERVKHEHTGKTFDAESAATDLLAEIRRSLGGNGAATGPRGENIEQGAN